MTYNEFKQAVTGYAAQKGLTEYDLYYQASASTTVKAYKGEVDSFSDKTALGACFRCIIDGKTGYSHTQELSEKEAKRLVDDASACAGVLESTGFAAIYEGGGDYTALPQSAPEACDVDKLKQMAVEIERLALAEDERMVSVPYAYISFYRGETALANSHGVDLSNVQGGYTVLCEAVAEQDGRKFSGDAVGEYLTAEQIDLAAVAKEAVALAVGSIGGSTVPSGQYPVVFSRRMMCEMLSCFQSVFSGDAVQKGLSLLSGKEGTAIASEIVTLTDAPHLAESLCKTPFDDEGVPTFPKTLIENGVLKALLYDMQSAARAGRASTGNGRKRSYAGDVSVAPWNLCLQPGGQSFDQLLAGVERGVYITELKGMHASANASTGDFSLESKGWLIEGGKRSRPIEQFTIAGNFYRLLGDITGIANDFVLEGGVGSASALVKALSIAGES
ncbi:TldD/PmbA family protein [Ruminococcaceae bacterium OttesenSCG-928-L11]|nr:TldD/PmbA family protein [Ruminococcaceae bacterium OttesenSCG-928-L11]